MVGDLHQRNSQRIQRTRGFYDAVVRGQCLQLLGCSNKGQASDCRNFRCKRGIKPHGSVESGSYCRAALGEAQQ